VSDLFVDWHRLQGIDAKQKLPNLHQTISGGDMEGIVRAFQEVTLNGGR
jgi:hypothetical protein